MERRTKPVCRSSCFTCECGQLIRQTRPLDEVLMVPSISLNALRVVDCPEGAEPESLDRFQLIKLRVDHDNYRFNSR